jgi:malonyl CoA-acyl carrier protein transacylase
VGTQQVSEEHAAFAPISFPMIALTQLLQYLVLVRTWDMKPSEVSKNFLAAVGHSQGLISAVAVATTSDSDDSVVSNVRLCSEFF